VGDCVVPEDLCYAGWVVRERESNLMLADLNVREEIEGSAFSYKACLLGLGLWYIQVRFGGNGGEKRDRMREKLTAIENKPI
jgi:hypothetical protein